MKDESSTNQVTIVLGILAVLLLAAIPLTMILVPPPVIAEAPMPFEVSKVPEVKAIQQPQAKAPSAEAAQQPQASAPEAVAAQQLQAQPETVEYTLRAQIGGDPMMAFVGVGGEIEGKVNPELKANVGDTIRITVVNGSPVLHDFAIDAFGVHSEQLTQQDQKVTVEFVANQAGEFEYYCTIPGHRDVGMKGLLRIEGVTPSAETAQAAPANGQTTNVSMQMGSMQPGSMQMVSLPVAEPTAAPAAADAVSIVRNPADVPPPVGDRGPQNLRIDLTAKEVNGILADGTTYRYMTFDGQVPGPMIRVRVSDTVELHLHNDPTSQLVHSIDLHAVTGPGGGAVYAQTVPGQETMFTFQALQPGLYVYHCATPSIGHHISSGMFGLILVEPEGGLPPVDHEFYFMQSELYTAQPFGTTGQLDFSHEKMLDEDAEYFTFNGAAGALTKDENAMHAKVGDTVRVFFGVGGPNATSSFHLIGEIFDRVYDQASLTSAPLKDVQTTTVAPGGATMVEFRLDVPGRYLFVDHALSRLERGLAGFLYADGEENPAIFHGEGDPDSGGH